VEPLIRGNAGKETERAGENRPVRTERVEKIAQRGLRGLSLDEPEEGGRAQKTTTEKSFHSVASKRERSKRTHEQEDERK
jgi:hypothetical protein